jgi:ABC-type polysaccharide/polyol phosphate export permease
VIRVFATGVRLQLLQLMRSGFDISAMLVWPVILASIAFYLLDAKESPRLLFAAALGTAVMMMWAQVIVGAGGSLDNQRVFGTLELLVAAPVPLASTIAPIMIASGAFGIYGLVVTLVWGRVLFGIPVTIDNWYAFVAALPSCVIAIGLLGLIAASTFVLYRAAFALGISLQYPVWIVTGLLFPLSLLPAWVGPISWVLAPTWGFRAIREAALGGSPWFDIGMCWAVSAAYLAVSLVCLAYFERLARDRASFKLA